MKLCDLASVIRSKNAGPFELTFDMIMKDDESFRLLQEHNVINKKSIAKLYCIEEKDVLEIVYFPNARAIKATIVRPCASGALEERDVYGAQQHGPLVGFEFDI